MLEQITSMWPNKPTVAGDLRLWRGLVIRVLNPAINSFIRLCLDRVFGSLIDTET